MLRRISLLAAIAVFLGFPLLAGCLTPRGKALVRRQPTNRLLQPDDIRPLEGAERYRFYEYDAGGAQNVCVLQLAPDARLTRRYHKGHDLTMLVVSGSAIVKVEEARYAVKPASAVMLPAYTAYEVRPHNSDGEFVALMIFTPPYDGTDVVLED